MPGNKYTTIIKEQCSESEPVEIKMNILFKGGQIWIQPEGYGEKCVMDGEEYPIGIEIWQGKLRLLVFDDISNEEAKIIDLENAKESRRHEYCKAAEYLAEHGRKVFTGCMIGGIWNGASLTACIMSHKQDDKAAYEYLLKIADKYSTCLNSDQQKCLQKIKLNAASLLNREKSCNSTNEIPV